MQAFNIYFTQKELASETNCKTSFLATINDGKWVERSNSPPG